MKKLFTHLMVGLTMLISTLTFGQSLAVKQASYTHKPIVEMTLNNKKTWVLLDTGADITILDITSKKKYGFTTSSREEFKVPGFGSKDNQLHRAFNADLKFGNTLLRGPMYAFDITSVAESIEARTGKRITAIIGTTMMKTYGFVIDMGNNSVVMYSKIKKSKKQDNQFYSFMENLGTELNGN